MQAAASSVLERRVNERLAFEAATVRLYEALMVKCTALPPEGRVRWLSPVGRMLREKRRQLEALESAANQVLGTRDPREPCAPDVDALGLLHTIEDPATTLEQSFNALLGAELVEREGWMALHDTVNRHSVPDLAAIARTSRGRTEENIATLRAWSHNARANAAAAPPAERPPEPKPALD